MGDTKGGAVIDDMTGKIIHADCLDIMRDMPDNCVDLVLTDPPYGIGTTNFGPGCRKQRKTKDWNNSIPSDEIFDEMLRISKNQIIWGCNYFAGKIQSAGRIVHHKLNKKEGFPIKYSACDLASQSFDNCIRFFPYRWDGNLQGDRFNWKNDGPDARIHPTQKPLALMQWCISKYSKEGNLILDCFSGSGTTAIACHNMDRRFICIEKEHEYVESSRQRLIDEQAQMRMEL